MADLITGGCGFVGRNLAKSLFKKDHEVWIIDDLFTGRPPRTWLSNDFVESKYKKGIKLYRNKRAHLYFIKADLVEFLDNETNKSNINILPNFSNVFHLASIVGGRELIENDPLLVSKDLAIDSYFFLWLTRCRKKFKQVLYASSSAAYPVHLQNNKTRKLKESDITFDKHMSLPDMTYGWGKLTGEYLSRLAYKNYGIKIACVRPFSGYGEDQESVYPIPAIARRVVRKENPLTVWGTGRQGRDFVHIEDCINAFYIVMKNIKDGSAINIGSGKLTTFLEVLGIFTELADYEPKITKLGDKPVGVSKRFADVRKLKDMGWVQKVNLNEGFHRVYEYIKNVM